VGGHRGHGDGCVGGQPAPDERRAAFDRALAVLLLTPEFFLPLRQMAIKYHAGATGKAAAGRIYAILDTPLPGNRRIGEHLRPPAGAMSANQRTPAPTGRCGVNESADRQTPALGRFDIRFDDVSFAYPAPAAEGSTGNGQRQPQPGAQRAALHGFSLTIPHGQTVALVGPTGAGKTTVASLLLRFIDPNAGRISVGGVPLDNIDRAMWRREVAWVPQLPHLFHGTVADNIRLPRPQAGMDAVIAAARAAHADEFIEALPRGYDTPLGEQGARLSGGQRQRLAIARAFLKDARSSSWMRLRPVWTPGVRR